MTEHDFKILLMRVAIVHYHLRPGGVTRVIQNALTALEEVNATVQTVILAGEPPSSAMPVPSSVVVESLRYSTSTNLSPKQVLADLESAAASVLGGKPDLWHFHNHALGKNLIVPEVVVYLVQQGQHVLLQPHDFAEDGRPGNYQFLSEHLGDHDSSMLGATLYPQGRHVHYALINQRDLNFLRDVGVQEDQLHYLPNAVSAEHTPDAEKIEASPFERRTFFYPARAIRRKNLGEFLLWAALAEKDDLFAVARSPKNPAARPIYDGWLVFADALKLPVRFGLGETWQGDFLTLVQSAHALVTTSVAEGFGLAFLEPWLAGRPLVGRKLPEITDEFERANIDLSSLYMQLKVPIEWIGLERFVQEVRAALTRVYASYGRRIQPHDVERAVKAAMSGQHVDFGRLDEPLQQAVICRVVQSPLSKRKLIPSMLESSADQEARIRQNRTIVAEQFNLRHYGEHLADIYRTVAGSGVSSLEPLDASLLLDKFLAPERFCLLRT